MERAEHPDVIVDRVASAQRGVISSSQLREAGLSRRAIQWRAATGRLHGVFRGVYRVGPLVAPRAREQGAVLACGGRAVLSHRTAGAIWELTPAVPGGSVEVSVPRPVRRRVAGIVVHRSRSLDPADVTSHHQLPLTTPERTLLDLATVLPVTELERAMARAERAGLVRMADLRGRIGTGRPHRGAFAIRTILDAAGAPALTRSEAEARLLELIRRARLPRPRLNELLAGYEVDFLWAEERVVVEVDGYAFHGSQRAFSRDRRRDAELTSAGFRVLRFTWDDIAKQPEATLVILTRALARACS